MGDRSMEAKLIVPPKLAYDTATAFGALIIMTSVGWALLSPLGQQGWSWILAQLLPPTTPGVETFTILLNLVFLVLVSIIAGAGAALALRLRVEEAGRPALIAAPLAIFLAQLLAPWVKTDTANAAQQLMIALPVQTVAPVTFIAYSGVIGILAGVGLAVALLLSGRVKRPIWVIFGPLAWLGFWLLAALVLAGLNAVMESVKSASTSNETLAVFQLLFEGLVTAVAGGLATYLTVRWAEVSCEALLPQAVVSPRPHNALVKDLGYRLSARNGDSDS